MKRRYLWWWLPILASFAALVVWVTVGGAFIRRRNFGVPPIAEASRTQSRFVVLLLPRISAGSGKYTMSGADLRVLLAGLKAEGAVSIGLRDAADFYQRGRLLPPKAVLLAFAEDDPQGVAVADGVLKGLRLRGVDFVTRLSSPDGDATRRYLTRHAVEQMVLGAAWEFGALSQENIPALAGAGPILALLDDDGRRPAPKDPSAYPLRFVASELGFDDRRSDPHALNALALRPDRTPEENLRVVDAAWPRQEVFADEFEGAGLGADWISGWGVVARGQRRLALLPTPKQSGAGVFLRGTESWRDVDLEFELKRYQKEFWAYARYKPDGSFVRVGLRGGYWSVEQKTGARGLPTLLGRAPLLPDALPARVRFVLKGGAAIVHVNGRMQFGRPLPVNPAVDRGRVLFGVYDAKSRSAQAVLTSVRAAPLGEEWIAPRRGGGSRLFEEERLDGLREAAVGARVLSPRWVTVAPDGAVTATETQGVFLRALAGFYSCRLVPMAEFPSYAAGVTAAPAYARRALEGLTTAIQTLGAGGLNLRLRDADARRPETLAFLKALRAGFHARGAELWVTVDGSRSADPELDAAVDGVLRPSSRRVPDLELLTASRQTESRTQRESAIIQ